MLLRAGRLRAEDREHRGGPQPEEVRAGLQRCGDPGQPGVRPGQIQADRHLRNAQAQRHPDGSVGVRGPHLQSGSPAALNPAVTAHHSPHTPHHHCAVQILLVAPVCSGGTCGRKLAAFRERFDAPAEGDTGAGTRPEQCLLFPTKPRSRNSITTCIGTQLIDRDRPAVCPIWLPSLHLNPGQVIRLEFKCNLVHFV